MNALNGLKTPRTETFAASCVSPMWRCRKSTRIGRRARRHDEEFSRHVVNVKVVKLKVKTELRINPEDSDEQFKSTQKSR